MLYKDVLKLNLILTVTDRTVCFSSIGKYVIH